MIGTISGSVYPMLMCLDVSLAALPLFYAGYLMKKAGFANVIAIQPILIKCSNLVKFVTLWIIIIFLQGMIGWIGYI